MLTNKFITKAPQKEKKFNNLNNSINTKAKYFEVKEFKSYGPLLALQETSQWHLFLLKNKEDNQIP